ncbi:MAG TPA: ribose-5-phosphate isomerase RpiA [Tepidisphaeraceae bacterium]|jgi:ribose 5-phosphate isomerase A
MTAKHRAAAAALAYVKDGMTVGLGTGSTAQIFIDLLGAEIVAGRLKDIRGIPTSVRSDHQARSLHIRIVDFSIAATCDITIDGADEVADDLSLIKGLGGALLREKLVAQNSTRLVVIADASKRVSRLGTKTALPVEVVRFSHHATERFLRTVGCTPVLRMSTPAEPFVTDNGNFIYDCQFPGGITAPGDLDRTLRDRAGVVETGLFVGIAAEAIIGTESGVERL